MSNLWTKLTRKLGSFRTERGGNVVITFALATLPIIGTVGFAVDYSHANSVKAAMQAALNSTALMLAKDASTVTNTALQTEALNYFTALFTRPEAKNIKITATYTTTGGSAVTVNGSADVPTQFLGIIGFNNLNVNGSSQSAWGTSRLRVALALDNTGSMADDGKMAALKTATKSLLTQLQNAASVNGDVYVSIIPFSRDVSVDASSNYNASWIDWTDWEAAPSNSVPDMSVGPGDNCPYSSRNDGYTCSPTPTSTSTTSTVPNSGTYKGYICPSQDGTSGSYYNGCYNSTTYKTTGSSATCSGHSHCSCSGSGNSKVCQTDSGYYEHAWVVNDHSTWNGCITDRGNSGAPSSNNYDQKVTAPASTANSKFPAEQYGYCTLGMMGLNYNWTAMASMVNSMQPNGNTNQPIGLVWAWQSLVGGGPLTMPAKQSGYTYTDIIILLSDGLNTQDRWYNSASSIDGRMYKTSDGSGTCANIKNSGVTIYSIQVNTGGDATSVVMQNCAGSPDKMIDPSKFYQLTTAGQIATVFNQIGTNLTQLRVAK